MVGGPYLDTHTQASSAAIFVCSCLFKLRDFDDISIITPLKENFAREQLLAWFHCYKKGLRFRERLRFFA